MFTGVLLSEVWVNLKMYEITQPEKLNANYIFLNDIWEPIKIIPLRDVFIFDKFLETKTF